MGAINECTEVVPECLPAYGIYSVRREFGHSAVIERKIQKSEEQKNNLTTTFNHKLRLDHPHIVRLSTFLFEEEDYSYRLVLVYPLITSTLNQRAKQIKYAFDEDEILRMLCDMEAALTVLYESGTIHAQINADTILFDNGKYYLTDIRSMKGRNSYEQALSGMTKNVIMSPNLVSQLRLKCLMPTQGIQDDLFSLAIVCICLITRENPDTFYNWSKFQFKTKVINNKLIEVGKKYSSKLVRRLKELMNGPRTREVKESVETLQSTLSSIHESYLNIYQKIKTQGLSARKF